MKFSQLVLKFEELEGISSRNEMTQKVCELFALLSEEEMIVLCYLLLGRVAPLFVNAEFQISEKSVLKVLGAYSEEDIFEMRKNIGDIGLLSNQLVKNSSKGLDILEVYGILWDLVNMVGVGSVDRKYVIMANAFASMNSVEAKYFSRIVCGSLRLGFSAKTILDAFSYYLRGDKSERDLLERAYGVCADLGYIASFVNGHENLEGIEAVSGIPILSRLVERAKSFEELQERMGEEYIVQPKFDGLRLQIHKNSNGFEDVYSNRLWFKYLSNKKQSLDMFSSNSKDMVRLFTRNLEDVTSMFPEIVEAAESIPFESFVLDSEVVGWDFEKGVFKTYQDTMTRKRKYEVGKVREGVPVKAFAFDLLYLNGVSLILRDTKDRIDSLFAVVSGDLDKNIVLAQSIKITEIDDLKSNFHRWVDAGLEGLIAKKPVGNYSPGSRDFEWIKLKKSFMSGLSDSVDVVILGYYLGSGKRVDFGIGAILCGLYNKDLDRFESLTKLGTGVTDDLWKKIVERLKPLVVKNIPKNVYIDDMLLPDVWVYPEVVCTIEADDITRAISSDFDSAPSKGLSLRFPRMVEFDREKSPFETTSVIELEEMYQK